MIEPIVHPQRMKFVASFVVGPTNIYSTRTCKYRCHWLRQVALTQVFQDPWIFDSLAQFVQFSLIHSIIIRKRTRKGQCMFFVSLMFRIVMHVHAFISSLLRTKIREEQCECRLSTINTMASRYQGDHSSLENTHQNNVDNLKFPSLP